MVKVTQVATGIFVTEYLITNMFKFLLFDRIIYNNCVECQMKPLNWDGIIFQDKQIYEVY